MAEIEHKRAPEATENLLPNAGCFKIFFDYCALIWLFLDEKIQDIHLASTGKKLSLKALCGLLMMILALLL